MTDATSSFRDAQRGLPLTDTHRRALDALSRGATWRRLSRSLDTTVDGVKHQLRGLYARLDAHNAAHAVRLGFEAGLLRPDAPTGVDVDELRRAGLLLRDGFTSLARAVRQPTEPTRVTHDRRAADG